MTHIEAMLNSRPSDNPNDLTILTPGNFLIEESFTTFRDLENNKSYHGLKDYWKSVQNYSEELCKQWLSEYLTELQKRYKSHNPSKNINVDQLLLLKENNIP